VTELRSPLPSTAVLLGSFRAGVAPPQESWREIVGLAVELVEAHRRRDAALVRLRVDVDSPHDCGDRWPVTTGHWLCACEEIDSLVVAIEEAIHRRTTPATDDPATPALMATGGVGPVISRMAELWVVVAADDRDHEPYAETRELWQLCDAYTSLIDGIARGTVRLPPRWQWQHAPVPSPRPAVRSSRADLDAAIAALAERGPCEVELRGNRCAVVRVSGPQPRHGLHAVLTVASWGWWSPIWLGRIYASRPQRWRLAVDETGRVHRTPAGRSTGTEPARTRSARLTDSLGAV